MDADAIFGLQFLMSLVAWSVVAIVFLGPWLRGLSKTQALLWLTVPHAFRHIGLVFLVPGVVDQPLPGGFSGPAAYGDLAAAVLALVALVALRSGWTARFALAGLAHTVGALDLANALRHTDVAPLFGAAWYIPTFFVPLLLVTHALGLKRLLAPAATAVNTGDEAGCALASEGA
jgi:hypothetical protein